jgi:hypothetical protein
MCCFSLRPVRGRNEIGSVFTVVPNKILLFDPPYDGESSSCCSIDQDGKRRFSASFYADLLHRLGVVLVLRLDASPYDHAAFARKGIRVCGAETLTTTADADAPLAAGALEQFAELVKSAGGGVAIHCEGRLGAACTLITAWMAQLDLFPSPEVAAAWIAIARRAAAPVDMPALRRHWSRRWMAASRSAPAVIVSVSVGRAHSRADTVTSGISRRSAASLERRPVAAGVGGGNAGVGCVDLVQPSSRALRRAAARAAAAALVKRTHVACSASPLPSPARLTPPEPASPATTPRPEAPLAGVRNRAAPTVAASGEAARPARPAPARPPRCLLLLLSLPLLAVPLLWAPPALASAAGLALVAGLLLRLPGRRPGRDMEWAAGPSGP